MSEKIIASRLLQYHMDLTQVKENSSIKLASLTVIQEFLKNDKNGTIRQMFMDRGLIESILLIIDSSLDNQSELASIDVALKCLWFLSQLSIGPLQNMITHDVMRRLLYLLDVKGNIYHFTSKFSNQFQQLCENKHLIGRIQTKSLSSELHDKVHKLSNLKLKYLDLLPDNLKICSLFDTSDSEKDINITDHLLENFQHQAWPNRNEVQCETEDIEEWEDIFVSEVIDGPLFWAHIGMANIETVRDIQMALEDEHLQPTKCTAGDTVVVRRILDSDRSFYIRARVIKVDQWKMKVWALDYGYEMDLPCNEVYTLPDHIGTSKYSPQISLCKLAGVEPSPRHHVIPKLAASILSNMCQKSIPACEILVELGGIETLETFLHACPEPETIHYVLRLVTNIAFYSKMSTSISNSNLTECVLDVISKLLMFPSDSSNVLVACLNCLCNILFKNDTTRDKFYHHEGIETVMKVLLQRGSTKSKIYHACTHLLRIFVRKIDTEPSLSLQRKRSLDRQRRSDSGRSPPNLNKTHLDPKLKNCPSEFVKFVQAHSVGDINSKTASFQSRLYETAWSDDSDEEDSCLVSHTRENSDDITRPVTTIDATHYYGQTTNNSFILGSEVEFENDTTHELRPNKSIFKVSSSVIAKHVCGLLNSGKGGKIYFGISSTVQGVEMNRDDRDEFRIGVDRMMSDKISPCVLHSMFDVIYTPVVEHDEHTNTLIAIKDRFVAEVAVKPVSHGIMHTLKDGECFYRFGPHTSQLTALEMRQLIILEEEEAFMEEFKQLSMELDQLKSVI